MFRYLIAIAAAMPLRAPAATADEPRPTEWAALGESLSHVEPASKRKLLLHIYGILPAFRPADDSLRHVAHNGAEVYELCVGAADSRACAKLRDHFLSCLAEFYRPITATIGEAKKEVDAHWSRGLAGVDLNHRYQTDHPLDEPHLVARGIVRDAIARLRAEPEASCPLDASALNDRSALKLLEDLRRRQKEHALRHIVTGHEHGVIFGSYHEASFASVILAPRARRWLFDVARIVSALSEVADYRMQLELIAEFETPGILADAKSMVRLLDRREPELEEIVRRILETERLSGTDLKSALKTIFATALERLRAELAASPKIGDLHRRSLEARRARRAAASTVVSTTANASWYRRLRGEALRPTDEELPGPPTDGCDREGGSSLTSHTRRRDELPLLFFGVREGGPRSESAGGGAGEDEILIRIEQPGRIALALAAAHPTRWIVSAAPDVIVDKIAIIGDVHSVAQGLDSVPRTVIPFNGASYDWPTAETRAAILIAEEELGALLNNFRGCERSEWFFVPRKTYAQGPDR